MLCCCCCIKLSSELFCPLTIHPIPSMFRINLSSVF
uniref:Uncharacterized protein n=1 Tax=Arundo donax TaxID=35708 RepID=A0A0A9FVT3_ARUDO